jgi:hypothetical protein
MSTLVPVIGDQPAKIVEVNVRRPMKKLLDSVEGPQALAEGGAMLAGGVYEIAPVACDF